MITHLSNIRPLRQPQDEQLKEYLALYNTWREISEEMRAYLQELDQKISEAHAHLIKCGILPSDTDDTPTPA